MVVMCCQAIERHDTNNKKNQVAGSTLAVGAAVGGAVAAAATASTGGAAAIGVCAVGLGKALADARANRKVNENWERACEVVEDHHKARQEFIDAYFDVSTARGAICIKCPPLANLCFSSLSEALNNPLTIKNIVRHMADSVTISVAMECSETTAELVAGLSLQVGIISLDLAMVSGLTDAAAIAAVELGIECLPFVSVLTNAAKLGMDISKLRAPSLEATRLREIYEESKRNLETLSNVLKEFPL